MSEEQINHYAAKLRYETDAWDLNNAVERGEHITIADARSPQDYASEHIPGAINLSHRSMTSQRTVGRAGLVEARRLPDRGEREGVDDESRKHRADAGDGPADH